MISNLTIKAMKKYFENKEKRTQEEMQFLDELTSYENTFVVTCVTREDLADRGFDVNDIDDGTMSKIAEKMGDSLCETGAYWDALDCWGEYYLND